MDVEEDVIIEISSPVWNIALCNKAGPTVSTLGTKNCFLLRVDSRRTRLGDGLLLYRRMVSPIPATLRHISIPSARITQIMVGLSCPFLCINPNIYSLNRAAGARRGRGGGLWVERTIPLEKFEVEITVLNHNLHRHYPEKCAIYFPD